MDRRSPALSLLVCLLLAAGAARATPSAAVPQAGQAARIAARAAATAPAPPTATQAPLLPEVDVVGDQPGPGLWKISRGDHVLWVLGTLDNVPKRMKWRPRAVESALSSSQALLPSVPAVSARIGPVLLIRLYAQWRGMQRDPDRTQLRDWLPTPLYARFEALKARYDPNDARIEQLRPPFAALRLYRRALNAAGLTRTNEIEHSVMAMAEQRGVPVERARLHVADPLGTLEQVRAISPAAEVDCLAATMQRLETDLPVMQQRARDWAVGDVRALRALPYPNQMLACASDLSAAPDVATLVAGVSQAWMTAADTLLKQRRVSFATLPIYQLLATNGPLAHFRAEGYHVDGPG